VFGQKVFEITDLTWEVYAETLADVDTIVLAIRYNGGAVGSGSGFDFGSFSTLVSALKNHSIKFVSEQREQVGEQQTGALVHVCHLKHRVTLLRN
jgi:hypothetical protein